MRVREGQPHECGLSKQMVTQGHSKRPIKCSDNIKDTQVFILEAVQVL